MHGSHPTLDDRQAFLHKVWVRYRWSALRRALRPAWRLHRARLDVAGMAPAWFQVRPPAAPYLVVACVAGIGRACGWVEGSRLTTSQAEPT